jgi:hypothetical protein
MKKLMLTVVAVGLAMVMVADASAGIFGWRRRAAPVYVQPAPAATAQVQPGYRAFSYEPAAPVVRYQAAGRATGGRAYESAINKALGRGF